MLSTLLQALALASVGIISPGSITLVILLLMSDKSWRNAIAFAAGYLVMYSIIGASILMLGINSANTTAAEESITVSVILAGFGILLLTLTGRNWWTKPQTAAQQRDDSRFSKLVDGITPPKSFALAATVSVINMKNLTIFLTAVSVLVLSDLPLSTQLIILVPLVLIFCTSVITPIAIYFVFPSQASRYLNYIKDTISRNKRPLSLAVTLILGTLFLYRGLSGLL